MIYFFPVKNLSTRKLFSLNNTFNHNDNTDNTVYINTNLALMIPKLEIRICVISLFTLNADVKFQCSERLLKTSINRLELFYEIQNVYYSIFINKDEQGLICNKN